MRPSALRRLNVRRNLSPASICQGEIGTTCTSPVSESVALICNDSPDFRTASLLTSRLHRVDYCPHQKSKQSRVPYDDFRRCCPHSLTSGVIAIG